MCANEDGTVVMATKMAKSAPEDRAGGLGVRRQMTGKCFEEIGPCLSLTLNLFPKTNIPQSKGLLPYEDGLIVMPCGRLLLVTICQ